MREIEEEEKGEKWKIIENIRMKLLFQLDMFFFLYS